MSYPSTLKVVEWCFSLQSLQLLDEVSSFGVLGPLHLAVAAKCPISRQVAGAVRQLLEC